LPERRIITLTIDGRAAACPEGTSLLDAAHECGITIPNLCHHSDLKPFGACRVCLVEEEKSGRFMAACVTPAAEGMIVLTQSEGVLRHRRNIVRLMMAEHPESCILCNKGNRCRLRDLAARLNIGETHLYPMPNYRPIEQANPFIARDLSKCILCARCIRADHELVVVGAIDYIHRGFRSRPATAREVSLERSNCTFCGTCVSLCPTGALMARQSLHVGSPEREAPSVCGFCGVGCALRVGVSHGRIMESSPAGKRDSANGSTLCVRGHFGLDFFRAPDRLSSPMVRKDGVLVPVSWGEALDRAAQGLLGIKKHYGPQSIGFLGSSKCTNEENYLFQKMARVLLGTNHIDNGGSLRGRAAILPLLAASPHGGSRQGFASIEEAEIILILGGDPSHSTPVAGYHVKRASRRGIPLVVVDPRRTDLVPFSSLWLSPNPGGDLVLLNAIASRLIHLDGWDRAFVAGRTEGFEVFREALSRFDSQEVSERAGVVAASVEKAARLLVGRRIRFIVGSGILGQREGVKTAQAIFNLALLTGSLERENAGILTLLHENNQAGAWHMGAVPETLPGYGSLTDADRRRSWERTWGVSLSPDPGLDLVRMIQNAEKGTLKALYVMGENPVRALPESDRVRRALGNLELLVVQDLFPTETAALAHVLLPGAGWVEKAGAFTNMEGRVQAFVPAVAPPLGAKPDWEILDLLGVRLGCPRAYGGLERVRSEIAHHVSGYGAEVGSGPERPGVNPGGRYPFYPVSACLPLETDPDYPLVAVLGESRFQLGSGTRTGRSKTLREFGLKGEVEVAPADADLLELKNGDRVEVRSRHGAFTREMRIDPGIKPGMVYLPLGYEGNSAVEILQWVDPSCPESPGWKHCPVRLERKG
jgi:formate dehydrogenase alpha subunit